MARGSIDNHRAQIGLTGMFSYVKKGLALLQTSPCQNYRDGTGGFRSAFVQKLIVHDLSQAKAGQDVDAVSLEPLGFTDVACVLTSSVLTVDVISAFRQLVQTDGAIEFGNGLSPSGGTSVPGFGFSLFGVLLAGILFGFGFRLFATTARIFLGRGRRRLGCLFFLRCAPAITTSGFGFWSRKIRTRLRQIAERVISRVFKRSANWEKPSY